MVNLSGPARQMLETLRDETGIPNVEAITRFLEWLSGVDRKFRIAILTRDAAAQQEFSRTVLSEMAGRAVMADKAEPVTIEQATGVISIMLERIKQIEASYRKDLAAAGKRKG